MLDGKAVIKTRAFKLQCGQRIECQFQPQIARAVDVNFPTGIPIGAHGVNQGVRRRHPFAFMPVDKPRWFELEQFRKQRPIGKELDVVIKEQRLCAAFAQGFHLGKGGLGVS